MGSRAAAAHPRAETALVFAALVLAASALIGRLEGASQAAPGPAGEAAATIAVPDQVVAFPGPGWRFASPETMLTFQGAAPQDLAGLRVTGERSGPHAGELRALQVGSGSVFRPQTAFAPGEQVTVEPAVTVRGATGPSFTFRTLETSSDRIADAAPGPKEWLPGLNRNRACRVRPRRYRTLRGLRTVPFCLRPGHRIGALRGKLLLSPRTPDDSRTRRPALMILDKLGRVRWYQPRETVVHDFKPVRFPGFDGLGYYVRGEPPEPSYFELVDRRYRVAGRVHAGNGYRVNGHEVQFTPDGTAYVAIYKELIHPDSRRWTTDFVVQEIHIPTGDVLFEWHSLDHVPSSASYEPRPRDGTSWDYFHGNSIELPRPGGRTLLVSARKTSAVYGIDRPTGDLRWILGGKQDQFGLVRKHPDWQFCAQHDARWRPDGDITLFDNGGANLGDERDCPKHHARVMRFELDFKRRAARLVGVRHSRTSFEGGRGYGPIAVGSARWQPNGDVLVNWGTSGRVTQVTPAGRLRFRLQLGHWSYRAVRAPWTGRPEGRPAVAARRDGRRMTVWASWNGATEIRRWRVLAGRRPDELRRHRSFRFLDLETRMRLRTAARHVAVQALGERGEVLGRSAATPVGRRTRAGRPGR